MEKLKIFKNSVLSKLEGDIKNNIQQYKNMKNIPNWLELEFEKQDLVNYTNNSCIEWEKPELIIGGPETDKENARRIYSALKGLSPVQAVQSELWTYLTHIVYPKYMSERWNVLQKDEENSSTEEIFIRTRYFANRGGTGIVRNGIARLWWAGKWGYDEENEENPFELCDIIFGKQETYLHVSERAYNRNDALLKEILLAIKEYDMNSSEIRAIFKEVNSLGSIEHLDSINRKEAHDIIHKYIMNIDNK